MPIYNLHQLNELQKDALRKTGNIGAGNAATALAELLNSQIQSSIPQVRVLKIQQVFDVLGGPDRIVVAVLTCISGDLDGMAVLIMGTEFAEFALKAMLKTQKALLDNISDIEVSAISELGNILLATYISAISNLADMKIILSAPSVGVDMIGAIMNLPVMIMGQTSDDIIYIEDDILIDDKNMVANILLIPSIESVNRLLEKLGLAH